MDILKIALDAGMQVWGNESAGQKGGRGVAGSMQALQRFADALYASGEKELWDARASFESRDTLVDCPAIRKLVESDPLMFI